MGSSLPNPLASSPEVISAFRGPHRFLSNFYKTPVLYEGVEYPSAEHAYQAAKTLDLQKRRSILTTVDKISKLERPTTPGEAKNWGYAVHLREGWESVKIQVMEEVLWSKFQIEPMRSMLLETGNTELIEGNTWGDTFWGTVDGEGRNLLGKLLMKIRNRLRGIQ